MKKNIARYEGLTLLEVILAGFILTTATCMILLLLLEQRVTIDRMSDQMLARHLLTTVSDQVQACWNANERESILDQWRYMARQLLPHDIVRFQCGPLRCLLCITEKKYHNTINTAGLGSSCIEVMLSASRY